MYMVIYMYIIILVKQVYWYISQVSGERLQDHWSSGFFNRRGLLRLGSAVHYTSLPAYEKEKKAMLTMSQNKLNFAIRLQKETIDTFFNLNN